MVKNRFIIIGGGGHAKVIIDAILSSRLYRIDGILEKKAKAGNNILGYPMFDEDAFLDISEDRKGDLSFGIGIGAVRASNRRKTIYNRYKNRGFNLPPIIHKKAYISNRVRYGEGVQIMAGTNIGPDTEMGENVVIHSAVVIEHDCRIASHCYISPGAVLGGNVQIGEDTFIGMGAVILQGLNIGSRVTVGAGAVVIKDVESGKTVAGVPAKEI